MTVDIRKHLLTMDAKTYESYYNGKMSYELHGTAWQKYVSNTFPDIKNQQTSENMFKVVIDLFADNLAPEPEELHGFRNSVVPLLTRGECPVVVDSQGTLHFPEHYNMISDGRYTVAAIFTRSLQYMEDYVTYVYSDGTQELYKKDAPDDLTPATREGYKFHEKTRGQLFRLALRDKGFGGMLASLQDRLNHSVIDQTIIAEMYVRPFWYLLNAELPPKNPYLDNMPDDELIDEQDMPGAAGRLFATSAQGPFGQLEPPTIGDMISYHDSIVHKISQMTGVPEFWLNLGGETPSGVALKVLSKRFNNKVTAIRDDITTTLQEVAALQGVAASEDGEINLWSTDDDLMQEAVDAHGLALVQMGYPLKYIAEVVTPDVDLDEYQDDGFADITPDQIAAYAANPGQRAGQPAINPLPTEENR